MSFDAFLRQKHMEKAAAAQREKEAAAEREKEAAAEREKEVAAHRENEEQLARQIAVAALSTATERTWKDSLRPLSECTICLTPIASGESVLLKNCAHAVCAKCAAHQREAQKELVCGVCIVKSPSTGIPHPLVEAELAGGVDHPCTKCLEIPEEDRLPAIVRCDECEWLLCESHETAHRRLLKYKSHVLKPLHASGAPERCPEHDHPYAAICASEECNVAVCALCLTSTHPVATHRTRIFDDKLIMECRDRLAIATANARLAAGARVQHAATAQHTCVEVEQRDAVISKEVRTAFQLMRALLDRREADLLSQLAHIGDIERIGLIKAGDTDGVRWRVLTSTADVGERLMNTTPTPVVTQLQRTVAARLYALDQSEPRSHAAPQCAQLSFNVDKDAKAVDAAIANLGRFVEKRTPVPMAGVLFKGLEGPRFGAQ